MEKEELKKKVKSIRKGVKQLRKVRRIVKFVGKLSNNEPESDSDENDCEIAEDDDE